MKICKYCKTEIPANAKVCPNCKRKLGMPVWLIVILVIIGFGIIGAALGNNNPNGTEGNVNNGNGTQTTTAPQSKFTYNIEKQYKGDYNIGYYIEGLVKNNTDKDYSYVQIELICYDKNGNNMGTALDNTNNLLANQTWKFKAMYFGSDSGDVDHCDYHEIKSW